MGKGTIGGKIVLEGESQYRNALKNIKSDQAELRSEMVLCQSTFKGNQNSLEALEKKYGILTKQVETQTKKIDIYKQALETASKKEEMAAQKVQSLQEELDKAEKELDSMSKSSDVSSDAMDEQAKAVDELKNKLALAEQGLEKTTQKTTSYQSSLNYAEAELKNMQQELNKTDGHMKEAEFAADHCASSLDEYGRETQEATDQTSVFGDVLKANLLSNVILDGTKALAAGIKSIAQEATNMGSSFEASMSQVAATMGMTAEEVNRGSEAYTLLANTAKECGKTTMFSASEAAEALNYLALAGYDAEKSAATLPKVLDLAAAGGLDLAYASDLVTDSMAALGLETDRLDTYIDEMARTSQKSNTSVAQLGEATLVCAGTVSLAKQSLETMNTELGVLANNGIKGAEGGTHLRNVILALSAPTSNASDALQELGVSISDSHGDMRALNDILIDLNASMSGMSSTEKTRMISRIFNKTDIAAVNALLKGTGDEYDELNEKIRDCDGAAAAMAETLNNNLKGKVTVLQSALEGLGISAYEIFDDDMKEAVDAATKAVGNLQKSIDSGDLGVSLNKMSKSLGEFMEGAIKTGEDVLPVMIDGFTWLLDNSDLVMSGIAGIAAANMEMKIVAPAIEAVTGAWQAYKLANEGATVSQWLLNTAMTANPAGMMITAITGLTAVLAALIIFNKDEYTALDETTRATKELIETSKELNESYGTAATERKTARESMETEATSCRNLVTELKNLQSKTTLTASEQARQRMIVDELNQAIPELNLAIDDQTGKLNMSTEALDDNIEAMMAMARATVAREDLLKIAEEQYEAEKHLSDLREQEKAQTEALTEAQDAYNEALERAAETGDIGDTQWMSQNLDQLTEAHEELEAQIEATQESVNGFAAEYEETLAYISETEEIATATSAMGELGDATLSTGERISEMSEAAQTAFNEMYDSVAETVTNQMNLFDEFSGKAELSTQELIANMESQVLGISQWSDNLAELAERGIDQGLLQHLADMGPEGAGYVATFVQMTDEELQKANGLFEEALSLPDATASKVADSYIVAGQQAGVGFQKGIEESKDAVVAASGQMVDETIKEARKRADEHSPSKKTEEIGRFLDEGLDLGIKNGQQEVLDLIAKLCDEVLRTTRNGLQTTNFSNIGKQIPMGLVTGIRSGKSDVVKAISDLCTEAVHEAKRALDIHSPSRKFAYLGQMSGEGYISGLLESMADIDSIVAAAMPETSMKLEDPEGGATPKGSEVEKNYNIEQTINIYSQTDNLVETTRKFKQSQKEAAQEW
ncbi:MAG: phage tail tape measure protein [Lachnospiraceae bacterium]|nr:phage tail tape measure protein [Lachnospiraceae bacterium]